MAAAWNKLGDEYRNSKTVIIADVDCTVEQTLCQQHQVRGYPTIKYWIQGSKSPQDYQGARDYNALSKFAKGTFKSSGPSGPGATSSKCKVEGSKDCSPVETNFIRAMKALTPEKRAKKLKTLGGLKVDPPEEEWLAQRVNILQQLAKKMNCNFWD